MIESHCIRDKSILEVIGIHTGLVKGKNHIDKHILIIEFQIF